MVRYLQFLLFLASQPLSLMDHLRFRRVCCDSTSLWYHGALAWNFLGIPWSPFCQIHYLCILSGGSDPSSSVIIGHACLSRPCRSLEIFVSAFRSLPSALVRLSPYRVDIIQQEIPMAPQKSGTWYCNPTLYRVCFLGLFIDFSWRTAWNTQGACITQKYWLSHHRYLFQSSYHIRRSYFLLNSCTYYIRLEDVSGPLIDRRWWRISDKDLVLNMIFFHTSYLMFYWLVI